VTYTQLQREPVLRSEFPLLCRAASETGSIANQGAINADTSGGTILLGSANGSVSNQAAIQITNGASLTITDLVNQFGATVAATGSTLTLTNLVNQSGALPGQHPCHNKRASSTGNFYLRCQAARVSCDL
jgi:hypothetical protein